MNLATQHLTLAAVRRRFPADARTLLPLAASLLTLVAIDNAGVRVFAVLGMTLAALVAGGRRLPRGPHAAALVLTALLSLGGALIARKDLMLPAAALFFVAGLHTAWGVNRGRARRMAWAWRAGSVIGAVLVAFFVVYPSLLAIDYLAKARDPVNAHALSLPHRNVRFPASDGVDLAGWYAPGRNGAAVVLVHGGGGDREGTIRHARMLARAGYGVLLYDARGRGESAGHENAFGWEWDRDVHGAVDFLRGRGVRRIGLLGLSTGAEAVVTEAASDPRVAVVVADGLQGRTPGDAAHLSLGNRISVQPAFTLLAAEIGILRGEHQPPPMIDVVHRVAANRPLLLIGTVGFERELDRAYVRGTTAQLWELPAVEHTKALAVRPVAYSRRVLSFFGEALAPNA